MESTIQKEHVMQIGDAVTVKAPGFHPIQGTVIAFDQGFCKMVTVRTVAGDSAYLPRQVTPA